MIDRYRPATAWEERDAYGLTDRELPDVAGLVVSTGIVLWLLVELVVAAPIGAAGRGVALIPVFGMMIYLASWFEEFVRQTTLVASTWRYGVLG